jgi:hypothetical protein
MKIINRVGAKDGTPRSFYTYIISFQRLCRCISKCPGVVFTKRRRFFWWSDQMSAEFTFKGREFVIEHFWADLHVCPKDEAAAYPEIAEISEHVEQNAFSPLMLRIVRRLHTPILWR